MAGIKLCEYRKKLIETVREIIPDEAAAITDAVLCKAMSVERSKLFTMLDTETPENIMPFVKSCIIELSVGKPLQYILGECNFYGYDIEVGNGVFIPRSDTEIGVEAALSVLKDGDIFADICSGSGCIAKAIAMEKKTVSGYALELSRKALVYTEKNLADVHIVAVRRFDALDEDDYISFSAVLERPLDMIICNPPYIPTEDIATLDTQVSYEPETALDGGEDGLRYYRAVTDLAPIILKRDGVLIYEIGINQCEDVSKILRNYGYNVAVIKDLQKIDRILLAKRY